VGALRVWTQQEAHHPRAQDDLSGPYPFGKNNNICNYGLQKPITTFVNDGLQKPIIWWVIL